MVSRLLAPTGHVHYYLYEYGICKPTCIFTKYASYGKISRQGV